jgi:hypothetical protein
VVFLSAQNILMTRITISMVTVLMRHENWSVSVE